MKTMRIIVACVALPAAAFAQAQGGNQGQQPNVYFPPAPPLHLDPSGANPVTPGAPANPYAPPGSGQVLGTQPPVFAPPQPMQPEGQQSPQQQGGIFLGGGVTTAPGGGGERAQGEVPEVHE